MPPLLQFVIRRFLVVPISLFVITLVLYGGVMLTPPEARVELYMPERINPNLTEEQLNRLREEIIKRNHLRDPFPVQYAYWAKTLFDGTWGFSPSMNEAVLPALIRRTPVTLELTLYSLLFLVPLGLVSGIVAAWNRNGRFDRFFRGAAFLATSTPTFILALVLLSIFYIHLGWFAPDRTSMSFGLELSRHAIKEYTGMLTIDSALNGRWDMFADAWRHLIMPVFTLSLFHWATLGRIVRATVMSERRKEYVIAARARGVSERSVLWRHVYQNVIAPSLTSMALSAASIVTGVFVAEIIFNFNGVSYVIVKAMAGIPDAPAALGFAIYSVIMVLLFMFVLDVLQAFFDPRVREGVLRS